MIRIGIVLVGVLVSACTQIPNEPPPLSATAGARCVEFERLANDMTTTAYRRATAREVLRAQRCPGNH